MGALLDLLLLLVTVRAIWRLVGGVAAGMKARPPRRHDAPPSGVQMARDPVCGTFVVPERSVSLLVGHERVYFCSTACRDQYRARTA